MPRLSGLGMALTVRWTCAGGGPALGVMREKSVANRDRRRLQGREAGRRPGTGRPHNEALPTRRLMVADATKSIAVAVLLGGAVALMLDVAAMLVASALVPNGAQPATDRIGLGIVAVSASGIVVFGLLSGYLATAARLALATFYLGFAPKPRELRDTVIVRGQANPAPYAPASASTIALGSLALLALIPCVVLALEHAGRLGDDAHRAEFTLWVTWTGVFLVVAVVCAAAVWLFSARSRRWVATVRSRLPASVVGERGPAARITTRAQRRVERRSWRPLDWSAWVGGALVAVGACIVFLGVYLRQPGLYAEQVTYGPDVERLIDAATAVGGTLLGLGILLAIGTGIFQLGLLVRALRRVDGDAVPVTDSDRLRVRAATTTLSTAVTAALIWWTVCGVVAAGWWVATQVDASAGEAAGESPFPSLVAVPILLVAWITIGLLLIGARIALEAVGPVVRNRFGYTPPSEADDREFPDLPLFGQ